MNRTSIEFDLRDPNTVRSPEVSDVVKHLGPSDYVEPGAAPNR